ncbi:hypothetical protein [Microcoleus sp. FACHB-672]|uniref:hypothetical protein n=1 Tax=Microcoleus sp. FACHB-672 TaxID=2692825 RepID=UPI00168706C8|nr:hypothetical protein [Microcoleus sp. FACHB-672]MBD2040393.1 hypothetical protein [Microcoleus sp. FACHB-672]
MTKFFRAIPQNKDCGCWNGGWQLKNSTPIVMPAAKQQNPILKTGRRLARSGKPSEGYWFLAGDPLTQPRCRLYLGSSGLLSFSTVAETRLS